MKIFFDIVRLWIRRQGNEYRYSPKIALFLAFAVSIAISGCSTLEVQSDISTDAKERLQTRHYQEQLQLSGRMLVRYQENGSEHSLSGSYEWRQSPSETNITLLSPLGQTIATITQNHLGATLQQANKATRYGQDIDSLIETSLGWSLPVAGLRDWLQGYARNAQDILEPIPAIDGNSAQRDGWQLQFASWQAAQPVLPKRIDLHRNTDKMGEVSLRIVIDQWEIP